LVDKFRTIGEYRILRRISEGRHSIIYQCGEGDSSKVLALKTLRPKAARSRTYRKQLVREAEIGLKLKHPNIIEVYDMGQEDGNPYYVMEYFPSKNLKYMILHRNILLDKSVKEIILQVGSALEYLHSQNLIHRDVKPDNILVNEEGRAKLIDFGLTEPPNQPAKGSWLGHLFSRRTVQGTRSYMSPEQIMGERLSFRSDIYSFGVTIYELVARKTPFVPLDNEIILYQHLKEEPELLQSRDPRINYEFDRIVMQMLAKDPLKRQPNMREVLQQLRSVEVFGG